MNNILNMLCSDDEEIRILGTKLLSNLPEINKSEDFKNLEILSCIKRVDERESSTFIILKKKIKLL